jgi:hypothetical protein
MNEAGNNTIFTKVACPDNEKSQLKGWLFSLLTGGPDQIRTGDGGFADLCLTTWRRGRLIPAGLLRARY